MGIFDKLEKQIDSAVNGAFARTFKGEVQPVEIAARLQKEIDAEARLVRQDLRIVPNAFVITLSRHDYERLSPYARSLNGEIVPELKEHAAQRGYKFHGPISITYQQDPELSVGQFLVESRAVSPQGRPGPNGRPGPGGPQRSQFMPPLVLEINGVRHNLTQSFVIGRGTDADVRVNDPGISRRHAQIRVQGEPPNLRVEIIDLGSTNGILVGGRKVDRAPLTNGTRIEMGTTRMLVHYPSGDNL